MKNNTMKNNNYNTNNNKFRPKGKGYSFQKTNKLLNKHGKAYREQDLQRRPGHKRRRDQGESSENQQQPQQPAVAEAPKTDSYADLLGSLTKRPRVYFEELLGDIHNDKSDSEGERGDDPEEIESESENESESDGSESEEEVEVESGKKDYFSSNFGSAATLVVGQTGDSLTVPHTLFKVTRSLQSPSPAAEPKTSQDLLRLGLQPSLAQQWTTNTKQVKSKGIMKPVSASLYPFLAQGSDVFFADSNFENQAETLRLLALHVSDHVMKTRRLVLKNNSKLANAAETGVGVSEGAARDQGFTRPKVLVLLPFRNVAHKFVHQMLKIALTGTKKQISNKKRFEEEYGPDSDEKPNLSKSLNYQKLFLGNNDDFFTLGIALAKNSVKLYTDFYNSDIILASPLGLRTVIGAEGDKQRDFDFLSSIEIMSLFMTDVFLMQNWEHLLHCLQHLNMKPTKDRGTDFSRVKMWGLDGNGSKYRQNLVFSSLISPEINSLLSNHCTGHRGLVRVGPLQQKDVLSSILYPVRQVFSRMRDLKAEESPVEYITTGRYDYFIQNILPRYQSDDMSGIVIVIPSYFDFVRVRNHLKREAIAFSQLSEYSANKSISNVRREFAQGNVKFLITTERFFFFKRYTLKQAQHVVFYEAPLNAECYSHYLNMLTEEGAVSTLLYNKLDGARLERMVGEKQCRILLNSKQTTHMIISE